RASGAAPRCPDRRRGRARRARLPWPWKRRTRRRARRARRPRARRRRRRVRRPAARSRRPGWTCPRRPRRSARSTPPRTPARQAPSGRRRGLRGRVACLSWLDGPPARAELPGQGGEVAVARRVEEAHQVAGTFEDEPIAFAHVGEREAVEMRARIERLLEPDL